MQQDSNGQFLRRDVLVGVLAGASAIPLAGCLGDDSDDENGTDDSDDDIAEDYELQVNVFAAQQGGGSIEAAQVDVNGEAGETDEDGQVRFELPEDDYTVRVEVEGFQSDEQEVSLPPEGGMRSKSLSIQLPQE